MKNHNPACGARCSRVGRYDLRKKEDRLTWGCNMFLLSGWAARQCMIGDSVVDDHRTARPGRADSEGIRYLRAYPSVDVLELLEEKEKDPV